MAILSDSVVTACITGKLLLDGNEIQLEPKEWIDLVVKVWSHVDGPAKSQHELTGEGGGPILVKGYVTVSPDMWDEVVKPNSTNSDIQPVTVAG